jgi:hypothetical protein
MITYQDLLDRFAKVAEDSFGSGGVLPSKADVNSAQGAPSHDAKEKADLPDTEPQKHTFEDGKVKKGPEALKPNKNVFMTRAKDSTIKQAEEAFLAGFHGEVDEEPDLPGAFMRGLLDELEKDASVSSTFSGRKIPRGRIKRTLARIVSPTVDSRVQFTKALRKLRKTNPAAAKIIRDLASPELRTGANVGFALKRGVQGAALLGAGVLGAKALRKKKKTGGKKTGKK